MKHVTAIIVAAGKGTRMGPNVDKLFLEVAGRPVVAHTWSTFNSSPEIDEIILVVRAGMEEDFRKLAETISCQKSFRLVPGGAERQNSVWNGLQALSSGADIVAIQDGARPCTTHQIISNCLAAARKKGAAVAAQKVTDTLKESDDNRLIVRNVDRSKLWAVQTPQVFKVDVIRRALREVINRGLIVTDDTAACELIGQPVQLIESTTPNPKVTTQGDLAIIQSLLARFNSPAGTASENAFGGF
ncbi:MAG TPA: 2-C-methyl-D-erythritol 4-phosphate cytidylyltransferase [Verrucomicrobiae bacterium]|jgi:2-C-methyl-D-erythritol 4-phosphate cytidylyltransferase|nr:2-C-methyl-D-erythritol 4-phosphate cytidylyltransferase [Verrucomicrobiae bacterium]